MLSHRLGFITSWKMLTRDKGWIKPLLVIALVSWVPILGQIVILGYGLEWARLTAWGVDAAPKQRKVDYGKMFATGGIAFIIALIVTSLMGVAIFFIARAAYRSIYSAIGFTGLLGNGILDGVVLAFLSGTISPVPFIVLFIVNLLVETLVLAMQLRATLYDGFLPGWRLDRVCQMVVRDIGGFLHVCLITTIKTLVAALLDFAVAFCGQLFLYQGIMVGMYASSYGFAGGQAMSFSKMGVGAVLLLLLVAVAALFVIQVVKVALQLVSINSMGQWFERFDVGRWGVSAAPLPDDVPHRTSQAENRAGSGPVEAAPADGADPAPTPDGTGQAEHEPILLGPVTVHDPEPEDPVVGE